MILVVIIVELVVGQFEYGFQHLKASQEVSNKIVFPFKNAPRQYSSYRAMSYKRKFWILGFKFTI